VDISLSPQNNLSHVPTDELMCLWFARKLEMTVGIAVQVRLSDDERSALDNYRRQQDNPPSRRAAARQLLRRALKLDSPEDQSAREVAA
jgi:hypothetical protein